jgi:nicotinamidase-related amidase
MAKKHVRHRSSVALLLIDVLNHFEFPDGKQLLRNSLPLVPRLVQLKKRARRRNVPVIYVNDNFGQWRSEVSALVAYCTRMHCIGQPFVQPLLRDRSDYCVLKPMHSGFYQSPLHLLLRQLGASSIILAGLATNICILCTAHDANMRDFEVTVVSDCCAARSRLEHEEAIGNIRDMARARVVTLRTLRFRPSK